MNKGIIGGTVDLKGCYKLPWTERDNPNGWIEPTTFCNIACPGCYRGIDKPEHSPIHLSLEEVKGQVDWFRTRRNVHTISIAGGEPLMYPHIGELISYAAQANLRVMLYTNGVLLSRELAQELSNAGLTQIVVHIDRFQTRPDLQKGQNHMELRDRVVEIMREVPSLRLGFIQPISANCNGEVQSVMGFLERNIDVVNLMVFTLYRNICWNDQQAQNLNTDITIDKVIEKIRGVCEYKPAAYLPSAENANDPTWLFAQRVGLPNRILGYFSPSFYGFAHSRYRKMNKKYLFISRVNSIKVGSLWRFVAWLSVARILGKYLTVRSKGNVQRNGKLYFQTILIIRGPEKRKEKWDLCSGCPDRMLYNGRLVPSCILEDLKGKDLSGYTEAG